MPFRKKEIKKADLALCSHAQVRLSLEAPCLFTPLIGFCICRQSSYTHLLHTTPLVVVCGAAKPLLYLFPLSWQAIDSPLLRLARGSVRRCFCTPTHADGLAGLLVCVGKPRSLRLFSVRMAAIALCPASEKEDITFSRGAARLLHPKSRHPGPVP